MRRVLVAEDDDDLREVLALMLRRAGYDVVLCEDGRVAWTYLTHGGKADMALLDVNMPSMDGLELCRRIRSHPTLKGMPVLMLTVRRRAAQQAEGYELGADDYLPKPFREEVLTARLAALERRIL